MQVPLSRISWYVYTHGEVILNDQVSGCHLFQAKHIALQRCTYHNLVVIFILGAGKLRAILDAFLADLASWAGFAGSPGGPCLQGFAAVIEYMLREQTSALQVDFRAGPWGMVQSIALYHSWLGALQIAGITCTMIKQDTATAAPAQSTLLGISETNFELLQGAEHEFET